MGLNVMRWPLRPAAAKKYQVSIVLQSLEGLSTVGDATNPGEGGGTPAAAATGGGTTAGSGSGDMKLIVVVKWKGSRGGLGSRFGMKRANSRSKLLQSTGSVGWDQTFENICAFSMGKDGNFQSWPVSFVVCKPSYGTLRAKPFIVGTLQVDLAELMGNTNTSGLDGGVHRFPITCNVGGSDIEATLSMSISFVELRTMFEGFESVHKLMAPAIACMGEPMWDSDDERYIMSLKKKGGNGNGNVNGNAIGNGNGNDSSSRTSNSSSSISSSISGSSSIKGLTSSKTSKKKSAAAKGAVAATVTTTVTTTSSKSSSTSITAVSSSVSLADGGEVTETEADGKLSPLRIRISGGKQKQRQRDRDEKMIISSSSAPPTSSDESLHGCSDNPFDSDSMGAEEDDWEDDDFVGGEDGGSEVSMYEKHISYGTLAGANLVAEEVLPFDREEGSIVSDANGDLGDGTTNAVVTVHSRATSTSTSASQALLPNNPKMAVITSSSTAAAEEPMNYSSEMDSSMAGTTFPSPLSMKGMLSWRKRKLSFRSPRSRGEPLLNKAYGEEGGDEIDWDRRQSDAISSEEKLLLLKRGDGESLSATSSNAADVLDFGDELFTVGSWEQKELFSRDGLIKLSANVFFASFDQRSESAAGESACTALVAVIADWLHTHPGLMPSKAEFDMLIRDGSAEWRKLCEVDTYKDRFPDRHFDLETVLEAGVRPLAVISDKSFVGFFQPERVDEQLGSEAFDFLKHAMTFDSVWDEIERGGPAVYIVSWNDHFFVLRLEEQCCYIIDTLGERLYEGCNQAYILHFDETTTLCNVPPKPSTSSSKDLKGSATASGTTTAAAGAAAAPETEGTHSSSSSEKVEKTEKGDKTEKTHKLEKSEKGEKIEKTHRSEKSEKGEKIEKTHKSEKSEKGDRNEKTHKLEKSEKSCRQTEADVAAAGTGSGRGSATAAPAAAVVGGDAAAVEAAAAAATTSAGEDVGPAGGEVVLGGKEACRQFVKGFFAAIQLREAELEAKKLAAGKITQTSIYQKLQIEFHYAKAVEPSPQTKSNLGLVV